MTDPPKDFRLRCPIPISEYPHVLLAHGGGGRLMNRLIGKMFLAAFADEELDRRHDSAVLPAPGERVVFTTDSYVVRPLFFPGGDIGSLAVHGTVNDIAMSGAKPLYLSAGFILEEGLPMETLWRVVSSMAEAARSCGVRIVTGDTKVVDRGKGDGVFINTAGVGLPVTEERIGPEGVRAGDALILSGDVGRHGMAIMTVREGLEFESSIESDSAPVAEPVLRLFAEGIRVHCLRDLTRGGLASALNEIAETARLGIELDETLVPVREDVRSACEILGFDPLYVANEGRFAAIVDAAHAERAVEILRSFPVSENAVVVGSVVAEPSPPVILKSRIGTKRVLDMISGEQLPRIC